MQDNNKTSMDYFTVNKFLNNVNKSNVKTVFDIINLISKLNPQEKKIVIKDERIKSIVGMGITLECKVDAYKKINYIFQFLEINELFSLYDETTIKNYFNKEYFKDFFMACIDKDTNRTINSLLNNDEMFKLFFRTCSSFKFDFNKISYDLFCQVIFKLERLNITIPLDFFSSINDNYKENLIKESVEFKTLEKLLKTCSRDVLKEFLKNDIRAVYMLDMFNIPFLINLGVEFNENILRRKEFFEKIKCKSFIDFRYLINKLEKTNEINIIEKRVNEYYDEIINSYDYETDMFKSYLEYLNNPEKINNKEFNYIYDENVWLIFRYHLNHDSDTNTYNFRNITELNKKLIYVTSKKLSEVIIDALFQDNIYNVWLNIKEMLRYNSKLKEKVISQEWENFYKMILNFDNIPNSQKIKLFNNYRDKKINTKFWEDLRKLKDYSYENIKENLFDVSKDNKIDNNLSRKYNVPIYDYREKEFTMLIRGQQQYREKTKKRRNCYSIISNENSSVYMNNEKDMFYYGYNSFDNSHVASMLEQDSYSEDSKDDLTTKYVNRIMTAKELVNNSSWYSEINIVNLKNEEGSYDTKKPDYLLAINKIEKRHIIEAKRLNIPIVLIKLRKLDTNKYKEHLIPFSKEYDFYVMNEVDANELKNRR